MHVFVTGGNGFIGSAVIADLFAAGHSVLALARSSTSASALLAAGCTVHHGSIEDLESLKTGAAQCDGVIHLGFIMDFADFEECCKKDRLAIEAIGEALAGSSRPFVVASGMLVLKPGEMRTEHDEADEGSMAGARARSEVATLKLVEKGVRSSIMRLAPTVHGDGDKGFIPMFIAAARKSGVSMYINDGRSRWTAVHRLDAARLFRLALEKGEAGARFHAIADECVYVRDIAELIGKRLNLPVVSKTLEEGVESLGWPAHAIATDNPASSEWTREHLDWKPMECGLLEDMEKGSYV
jgi:nucleoside-diphosphate-sugar epimerase